MPALQIRQSSVTQGTQASSFLLLCMSMKLEAQISYDLVEHDTCTPWLLWQDMLHCRYIRHRHLHRLTGGLE